MDKRLLWTVTSTFFLLSLLNLRTALAAPADDDTFQADEDARYEQGRLPPVILQKSEKFLVTEGETLRMPCNIDRHGAWAPMWYKGKGNDTLLYIEDAPAGNPDPNYGYQKENDSLIIHKVNAQSLGLYTCLVAPDYQTTHTVELKGAGTGDAGRNCAHVGPLVITILTTFLLCR